MNINATTQITNPHIEFSRSDYMKHKTKALDKQKFFANAEHLIKVAPLTASKTNWSTTKIITKGPSSKQKWLTHTGSSNPKQRYN